MDEKSNSKNNFYFGKSDNNYPNLNQPVGLNPNHLVNRSFNEDFLQTTNKENKNLINIKPLNTFNTYNTFNNHYNIQPFNTIRLNTNSKEYEELSVSDIINKVKVAESNLVIFMIEGIFENVIRLNKEFIKDIILNFIKFSNINITIQNDIFENFITEFEESKILFNKYEQYLHFIKNLHIQITNVSFYLIIAS